MSAAFECDRCGALVRADDSIGCLSLDVHLRINAQGKRQVWSDVDLCADCTTKALEIIRPALLDFVELQLKRDLAQASVKGKKGR